MKRSITFWAVVGFVAVVLSGCESTPSEEPQEKSEERTHYYSPYVVTGVGDLEFETISFTDVGLKPPEEGPVDAYLLETIAESLAYKIIGHEDLNFTPEVQYDQSLVDPMNHLFCEEHHLYIALWRGYEPERWGYSLWSGCEEHHEFAWEEVVDVHAESEIDLLTQVEPLTESIVESIKVAHETDCFTLQC